MILDPQQVFSEAGACIRCGACMEVCPLYQLTGQETTVARGKLSLLQALNRHELPPSQRLQEILEFCLLCGACTEKCTARVSTPELVKSGRAAMRQRRGRSWSPALVLTALSLQAERVLPNLSAAGPLVKRLKSWVGGNSGLLWRLWPALTGLVGRLPSLAPRPFSRSAPHLLPGRGRRKIAFFVGCGLEALFPQAGLAFLQLCQRLAIEVIIPPRQGCCGLLAHSAGEVETARELARRFLKQFETLPVDCIVTACASCSYHLKNLARLFPSGREGESAFRLAAKIREASEYLVETETINNLNFLPGFRSQSLIFHDPCHLRRGQRIVEPPRRLLAAAPGVEVLEPESVVTCCGQGGIFGICHPETAGLIGREAVTTYCGMGATALVTACSGCLAQLTGLAPPELRVRHFLEILAESL